LIDYPSEKANPDYFEQLYQNNADPWDYEHSEGEAEKRRLMESFLLPGTEGLELGCGPGFGTALFAPHFSKFTAIDASPKALELARNRVGGEKGSVTFRLACLPIALPQSTYSTVIAAEILYYLSAPDRALMLETIAGALQRGGRFILLNSHGPFPDAHTDAATLHREARSVFGSPSHHVETADYRMSCFSETTLQGERVA
jgi:SAM-dependent methyltransferase